MRIRLLATLAVTASLASPTLATAQDRPLYIVTKNQVRIATGGGIGWDVWHSEEFQRGLEALWDWLSSDPEGGVTNQASLSALRSETVAQSIPVRELPTPTAALHKLIVQAPEGYTSCRARADGVDNTGNSTIAGVLRTAPKSGNNMDGLHLDITVTEPHLFDGSHHGFADITVVFIDAARVADGNCGPIDGAAAFHLGP